MAKKNIFGKFLWFHSFGLPRRHEIIDEHMILQENMADFPVNTVTTDALGTIGVTSFTMMTKFDPSTQRVKHYAIFQYFRLQILNIYKYMGIEFKGLKENLHLN